MRASCRTFNIITKVFKSKSIIIDNKNCRAIIKLPYTQNAYFSNGKL